MSTSRTLPRATIQRMVHAIDPDWDLHATDAEERGHTAVYRVEVDTGDEVESLVLKATPDDERHGIAIEARLLALLDDRTGIPVPTVVGAVDTHRDLPTPFFLMESSRGTAIDYQQTRELADAVLERLADQTGAILGELHSLDAVEAFGAVSYDGPDATGGQLPTAEIDRFGVREAVASWPAFLEAAVEPELQTLAESSFDDLVSALRPWFSERIEGLSGTFTPVLGRIDHGVHNLLVDPESGEIETVIDWGFTLGVTPGYDLRTVEFVLSGAVLHPLADAKDRRALVRDAMAAGYRERATYPDDELSTAGELYELMAVVRAMNHLDAGVAKVPTGSESVIAAGLRADVDRLLGPGDRP